MGQQSRSKKDRREYRASVGKFAGGRVTAEELQTKVGIRKKCEQCKATACMRIKVFVQVTELEQRAPDYLAALRIANPHGSFLPTIPTKYGPMLKVSDVGACKHHRLEAIKAAAAAPSWAIVEIDDASLLADKPQVSVL